MVSLYTKIAWEIHGAIRAGEVQRMSAGTRVMHSEINESARPVHLYQIWIIPHTHGLKPSYEQKDFSGALLENALTAVASGSSMGGALSMSADATIYRGKLSAGKELQYTAAPQRGVFVYVLRGGLQIGDSSVSAGDQLRITDLELINFSASEDSEFVLIDVALF